MCVQASTPTSSSLATGPGQVTQEAGGDLQRAGSLSTALVLSRMRTVESNPPK